MFHKMRPVRRLEDAVSSPGEITTVLLDGREIEVIQLRMSRSIPEGRYGNISGDFAPVNADYFFQELRESEEGSVYVMDFFAKLPARA